MCSITSKSIFSRTFNLPANRPNLSICHPNRYIRVAHVYKVLRYGYLMIGIDGHTSKDASDCFCLHKSKALPIDWCKKNRVSLTVPEGWESSRFNYSSYLKSENAIAAPDSLFEEEPTHGFKKGMYVEAVDVVEPHMICPAFSRYR